MSDSLVSIKIRVSSAYRDIDKRSKSLYNYLENRGYTMYNKNNQWYALNYDGEGEDLKEDLRSAGFSDQEFKISIEYQRKWGFL